MDDDNLVGHCRLSLGQVRTTITRALKVCVLFFFDNTFLFFALHNKKENKNKTTKSFRTSPGIDVTDMWALTYMAPLTILRCCRASLICFNVTRAFKKIKYK